MCGLVGGLVTATAGVVFIIITTSVGFGFLPNFVNEMIKNEVILMDDTIQMERFEEVPFPLNFTVRLFNITNRESVLNGATPILNEVGPYVYKLRTQRILDTIEDDKLTYFRLEHFEFDAVASYPNTEDDIVTIVNVPYHAILQVAEKLFPNLMPLLNTVLNGVFGSLNSPISDITVRKLLFTGVTICENPGVASSFACSRVKEIAASSQNLVEQDDGSISFSLLAYKNATNSSKYEVYRGLNDFANLGWITSFANSSMLSYWSQDSVDREEISVCNMINGTDSGLFSPFIDRSAPLWAYNSDICRTVELRYQYDTDYEEIPAFRFSANEWFLDNSEGCFCLNLTSGVNREDGCLLRGAMELYSCVDAFLVLSYPHFLYGAFEYLNGVIGMNPREEQHKIELDLEPHTGTILNGAKRAQINIFMRPILGITATQGLRTTLTPIFWTEETMQLPPEFVDELKTKLLAPLSLLQILIPVVVAVSCVVLLLGVAIIFRAKFRRTTPVVATQEPKSE